MKTVEEVNQYIEEVRPKYEKFWMQLTQEEWDYVYKDTIESLLDE